MFCKENNINYFAICGYTYGDYISIDYLNPNYSDYKGITLFKDDIREVNYETKNRK